MKTRTFGLIALTTFSLISCKNEEPTQKVASSGAAEMAVLKADLRQLQESLEEERAARAVESQERIEVLNNLQKLVQTTVSRSVKTNEETTIKMKPASEMRETEKPGLSLLQGIERRSAVGETHNEIFTLQGETYRAAEITAVDEIGIRIRHASGVARLTYTELPSHWRKRFGYCPARAKVALEAEAAQQRKYQRVIHRARLARSEEKKRLEAEERERAAELALAEASRPEPVVIKPDPLPAPPPIVVRRTRVVHHPVGGYIKPCLKPTYCPKPVAYPRPVICPPVIRPPVRPVTPRPYCPVPRVYPARVIR